MQHIKAFAGEQLTPGDPGYEDARTLHNAMVDRRPALIARCAGVDDVLRAVDHARRADLPLAVRAGGHSVTGACLADGGVVVDVRGLTDVEVDPSARIARAGAGLTWHAFDTATQEHGLATTGGRMSTTGIAGFTLGGGSGWLERKHGLACDNLVAAQLVTADAEVVEASATDQPDLLWALRGGGGNFGVVTRLDLALHPLAPPVFAGLALYDPADGRTLLRALRDFMAAAPPEASPGAIYLTGPPEEFVPPEWQGRLVVALAGMYAGPAHEGERVLRPLLDAAPAIVDLFGPIPYVDFQCMIDDPPGMRNWWTADYLPELPDEAIDAFCAYSETIPLGPSASIIVPWGGAVLQAGGETPLPRQEASWVVHPFGAWESAGRDREHVAWGRRSREVLAPWTTGGTYLNWIGDEGADRIRAAFGDAYERLVEVKTRWDPDNVFRGNQNIRPARPVEEVHPAPR